MAQIVRPTGDVAAGGWTTQAGSSSNLFAVLDESVADDADYAAMPSPAGETLKIALGNPTDPASSAGHVVRYRIGKDGDEPIDVTVALMQGATEIASWPHTDVGALALYEQTLTGPQADAITDYSALELWITADGGAPFDPSQRSALLLWLRADDPSFSGTADNTVIASIPDGAPGNHDATAVGSPTYRTNVKNGLPVIRQPLTSDYFTIGAMDLSAYKRITVYMVCAVPATGDRSLWEFGTYGSAGTGKFGLNRASAGSVQGGIRGNGGQTEYASWSAMTGGATDFKLIAVRCATDVARQEVWVHVDGDQHGLHIATSANTNTFGNLTSTLGARDGGTRGAQMDFCELIVVANMDGYDDYAEMAGYLATKWGITNHALSGYNILFEGDSMTEGGNAYFATAWPLQLMNRTSGKHFWTVTAVSGETIAQMQADRDTQIVGLYGATATRNLATFWGGTNDSASPGGYQSAATVLTRQYEHSDWLEAAGWEVAFITMFPRSDLGVSGGEVALFETRRQAINTDNRSNALSHATWLLDWALDPRFGDDDDELDTTYYDVDKVHPSGWGHTLLSDLAEQWLFPELGETPHADNPRDDLSGLTVWVEQDRMWRTGGVRYPTSNPLPYESIHTPAASNNDLTQSNGARRPAFASNRNGHPYMAFAGNTLIYSTAAIDLTGTNAVTGLMVVNTVAADDAMLLEFGETFTGLTDGFGITHETSNKIRAGVVGNVGASTVESAATTGWAVISFVLDKGAASGSEVQLFVNGSTTGNTTTASAENTNAFGTRTLWVGGRGPAGSETRFLASGSAVAAVLLWNSALSTGDRQAQEQFYCAKYGITWAG